MKVFLVIPTFRQGGAERVMSELANEFQKQNVDVHLILLAKGDLFYSVDNLVKVHFLGFENKGMLRKVIAEIRVFFSLRKLLKEEKPEAVLSFMDRYNTFTLLASSFLRLNVYISDRSNPKKKIPWHLQLLKQFLYKNSSGIIAQTDFAKKILEGRTGHPNIKIIFNPLRSVRRFPNIIREKVIINVGRLVPEKGQIHLLSAFSQVPDLSWKLVILGDGPLRNDLESKLLELGIQDRVFMPGSVLEVDEWLARSSIFVFPSISEGFPNALVEAMAAGLPAVSFDCDAGPRDIIEDGTNGFLIPVMDVDLLANRINKLVSDRDLRQSIGKEAEKVTEWLDRTKIASEYLNFISNEYTS